MPIVSGLIIPKMKLTNHFGNIRPTLPLSIKIAQIPSIFCTYVTEVSHHENIAPMAEDCKWDGIKGYITNTDINAECVIDQYHGLWVVERAFRISKSTLEMRPMFHFTERRIEAHICICFIVYKVYKEQERLMSINKIDMSVDQVLDIAKTITTIKIKLPKNGTFFTKTLFLTEKHLAIKSLFNLTI